MKYLLLIAIALLPTNVFCQTIPRWNIPDNSGIMVNNKRTDSIGNQSIEYYLTNPNIDLFSKEFYKGNYQLYDNLETFGMMDSIFSINPTTQPFYFYNFCRMVEMADGAIGEPVMETCYKYIGQNPCKFFFFLSDKHYNIDIKDWITQLEFVTYYYKEEYLPFIETTDANIQKNCSNYIIEWDSFKKQMLEYANKHKDDK